MNFNSDEHGLSFTLPDRPTVRQQLAYFSASSGVDPEKHLERMWAGARTLIINWECKLFPLDVELEKVTDPKITGAILWVSVAVKGFMNDLDKIPKN